MGRAVDWPWGVLGSDWALGSVGPGRLWGLGSEVGCGLSPGVCGVGAGLWTVPGVCWGQAVSWDQAGPKGLWGRDQTEVWGL